MRARELKRANRRARIQWAIVVAVIVIASGLLLLIGGDGVITG